MTREERLEGLGYSLGFVPKAAANYCGVVVNGTTAYVSGCLPLEAPGVLKGQGRVGATINLSQAQESAALCSANILRLLNNELGSLDRVKRFLRLGGFVNCTLEFQDSHLVINSASDLILSVLGNAGRHARTAVGVQQLPLGACVEIDALVEIYSE